LLGWGLSWAMFRWLLQSDMSPGMASPIAAMVGVAISPMGRSWWRRLAIAGGFPISLAVMVLGTQSHLAAWVWLLPLALLLLVYPIKTWADMKGMKVGVNRGSSLEREFVNREKELNLTILRFEDDSTVMQALFSGQVQAIAGPDAQAYAAMKARGDTETEAKFMFGIQPNSMALRKDATELHQWLNNVIYFIKQNGELGKVFLL